MLPLLAILLMIAADQLVKYWAFTTLQVVGTIPVIGDVFHLTYVENRGAAFNLMENKIWLFVVMTVAILCVIAFAIRKGMVYTALGRWSLYVISGGAVGNLIDRVLRGFVVDLFDFRLIHFPVFNVADIFVCVGGALFVYYYLFQHEKAAKK